MSFGTGYHETTRLMLRQLEEMDISRERIMDIGTGTGVLAIAARRLGNTQPILAFDNSSWAAENAAENIAENEASDIHIELLDAEEDLKKQSSAGLHPCTGKHQQKCHRPDSAGHRPKRTRRSRPAFRHTGLGRSMAQKTAQTT